MKACKDCGSTTRAAPFPGPRCATCHRAVVKARKARAQTNRDAKVYGLAEGDRDAILEAQDGVCPICLRANGSTRRLSNDHDHRSGIMRGCIDRPCNDMLGHGRDDPEMFRRAAEYLERPPAILAIGQRVATGAEARTPGEGLEVWRDVPGYGGWYEVSTLGRVRSWRGHNNQFEEAPRRSVPQLLKPGRNGGGYLFVGLSKSGATVGVYVSRLVLTAFARGAYGDEQAAHCNGNRQDNRLSNLRWATAVENASDKVAHGTQLRGSELSTSKLDDAKVAEARDLWSTGEYAILDLAHRYNVSGPTIWKAIVGKTWGHVRQALPPTSLLDPKFLLPKGDDND